MDFHDIESSTEDGRPITLYSFVLGNRRWQYASCAQDVMTADGRVWKASPISDDGVKQTGESNADALTITLATNVAVGQLFMNTPPSAPVAVTILLKHEDNPGTVVVYVGEVAQASFPEPGKVVLVCETLSASMRREGLRLTWQRSCPYVLYDPLTCRATKVPIPVTVTTVNGFSVTVSGATMLDGQYDGGFIAWADPVKGIEYLAIESNIGTALTIFGLTEDLYPGQQIIIHRGCARTPDACKSFNNYDNYGGHPYMPGKSPFDGLSAPVF